jgi:ParB family chromosome partitioning protein
MRQRRREGMLELQELSLTAIRPSPCQVRKRIGPITVQELATNLERDGQLQAILVRRVPGGYEIIAGHRCYWAMRLVPGATTILARVSEATDQQARRMLVLENLQREDLAPLEWIEAIAEMVDADLLEEVDYAALADTPPGTCPDPVDQIGLRPPARRGSGVQ